MMAQCISCRESHPTWVRGLKLQTCQVLVAVGKSHPTWVRGLKRFAGYGRYIVTYVAPYVGAWIETLRRVCSS